MNNKGGSMKRYSIILGLVVCLWAHTTIGTQPGRAWDFKLHDINQVEIYISNYGTFGHNAATDDVGCWWPKGSGQNYIFGAGVWFGTVDSTTSDTLVTIGYGPSGGEAECVPGLYGQDPYAPYVIIYMYPDPWPAPQDSFPMAPQDHCSHQDSWCCYNDGDSTHHMPGDTRPIDIEVYQTVYAWDVSPTLEDMVFFICEVRNVSGHTLKDCYFGICTDNDIGNEVGIAGNDRISAIVGRWYTVNGESRWVDDVGYQWQDEEEPGWADFPGVIAYDLLQTPFDLQPGEDKDNDGIPDEYERDSSYYWNNVPQDKWDVDNDGVPDWRDPSENPQIGMTAFKRFSRGIEPDIDPERYLTLAGYNFLTGIYEPYDTLPTEPADQRFLMASGPFDLAPDSTVTLVFALFFANWHDIYGTPDSALVGPDGMAQFVWAGNWYVPGIEEGSSSAQPYNQLTIRPNPITRHARVSFSVAQNGRVSLTLYDVSGRLVRDIIQTYVSAGSYSIDLDTRGLAHGTYFLVLETPQSKTSQSLVIVH